MGIKRKFDTIDKDNLVSATRIVNHVRHDPIIDYLDILNNNNLTIDDNLKIVEKSNTEINIKKRKTSFDYIVEEGYKFEEKIVNKIKKYMFNNKLKNKIINISKDDDIFKQFDKTKKILEKQKHDVILGGLLINKKNGTYGYPDLIVSGSWVNNFFVAPPSDCIKDDIYYIIDIKSSTINLVNGGKYVSSGSLFEGYKTQIWVYKEALDQIQNCESRYGFILGKKYKYVKEKNEIHINNSFHMLGLIDYEHENKKGNDYKEKIKKSVMWNKELRKNWKKYKIYPINKKILPNMKNTFDKTYRKIKKTIAQKNKDITLLWNCGVQQRNIAFKNEITKYDDKNLTNDTLGFTKDSNKNNIINKMLKLNKSNNIIDINKKNNTNNWQNKSLHEFFVDFETYSSTYDELEISQKDNENIECEFSQKIYMIGVGHFNEEYIFKCFIIDYLGSEELYKKIEQKHNCSRNDIVLVPDEKTLITTFIQYMYSFKSSKEAKYKFLKKVRLIHWSKAEPCLFLKKLINYDLNTISNTLPWYDLMEIFKNPEYPILIKNCFSFSLKDVTKTLNYHKFIKLEWPELDDGLLSAFIAKDIYKKTSNIPIENNNNMTDIIEYNYIDCKALYCILDFLRNL